MEEGTCVLRGGWNRSCRRDRPRVRLRIATRSTSPSPRNDRLGSRVVNLTRLQVSLHVAARVLAPSVEALDTPLGSRDSHRAPGVCYSVLRRLPRRDLHPLEKNDGIQTLARLHRHDAPSVDSSERQGTQIDVHICEDLRWQCRRRRVRCYFALCRCSFKNRFAQPFGSFVRQVCKATTWARSGSVRPTNRNTFS
jgi:hypothetical protein